MCETRFNSLEASWPSHHMAVPPLFLKHMFIDRLFNWAKTIPMKMCDIGEAVVHMVLPATGPQVQPLPPTREMRNTSTQFPEPDNAKYAESGTLTDSSLYRQTPAKEKSQPPIQSEPPAPVEEEPAIPCRPDPALPYDYVVDISRKSPVVNRVTPKGTFVFKRPDRRVQSIFTGPRLPTIESDSSTADESDIADIESDVKPTPVAVNPRPKGKFVFV